MMAVLVRVVVFRQCEAVIEDFGNRLAEDGFDNRLAKAVRRFPPELRRAAKRRKVV